MNIEPRVIFSPTTALLKLPEAATELSVGESTLDNWVYGKDPILASFMKDKIRRVSLQDLTRFVLLHTVRPNRPTWLTAAVESDFRKLLRQEVQAEWLELQRRQQIERAA